MTRENIIDRRRRLQVPDEFEKEWVTVTEVGFEDDWVSPIQKISNHRTGPVLVGKHWIDEESAKQYRAILERLGYVPGISEIPSFYYVHRIRNKSYRDRTSGSPWRFTE